jgi:hypothetical protein
MDFPDHEPIPDYLWPVEPTGRMRVRKNWRGALVAQIEVLFRSEKGRDAVEWRDANSSDAITAILSQAIAARSQP